MNSITWRKRMWSLAALGALAILAVSSQSAAAQDKQPAPAKRAPDVVYVPTPPAVVEKMLELAEVKQGDVVYDLGCGDGRIVVTAAKKYGVKAIGFDIDPRRVKEAWENVKSNKVEQLVTIKQQDIFTLDLREASVVTLYLLPDLNVRLMPQLAKLKSGSRIVSHDFDMRGAKPVQIQHMTTESPDGKNDEEHGEGSHTIYKWVVPWESDKPESKKPEADAAPKAQPSSGKNTAPASKP